MVVMILKEIDLADRRNFDIYLAIYLNTRIEFDFVYYKETNLRSQN